MQKLPTTLYCTRQIQELERLAIQQYGIAGFELMTQAGSEVFQCLQNQWRDVETVAVFCGIGNNAGDGYIVAKLALAAGLQVNVYALAEPAKLKGDAYKAYREYREAGGTVIPFSAAECCLSADVIVDALLGTGLDRIVSGLYAEAMAIINRSLAHVIAVDIPSGLCADTGMVKGCAVKADCTVTFIGLKQGLFTGMAADYCGEVVYASLSVPDEIFPSVPSAVYRVTKQPLPRRSRCAHKGNSGHVLVIGGDLGYSGAARLAGEAALRVGAGLVGLATRPEHAGHMNIGRPELMCHGVTTARQLEVLLEKAGVVVVGPGLGQSDWGQVLFNAVISSEKPLVIDADGLNLLAHTDFNSAHWILTPHPGEAARLLSCSTAQVQQDRYEAVQAIQNQYGGIAVLKGAGTLIASDHDIAVSGTGNPGMASGGMGDVLSGVIAGLLAQGLPLKEAAQQGVYLHGQAADLSAEKDGETGLLASDLMPFLRVMVN